MLATYGYFQVSNFQAFLLDFLYVATQIDAHTWTANAPYFEGFDPQS